MPTGLKALVVYLLGCAVFVKVIHYVLTALFGVASRTSLFVALPIGIVAFIVFIFANEDSHFEGWTRGRRRGHDEDDDD
jgi:hypothetical protein